jgi:hypothetical protein
MLCAETREEIADRMRDVLGDDYFTLVICNSYDESSDRFTSVEVYPSQWLTGPITDYRAETLPGITWGTQRLSMGVHTRAATPSEGRQGAPHKYVHFTFERDKFEIDHYAPAGYRLKWIFVVERHDRDED